MLVTKCSYRLCVFSTSLVKYACTFLFLLLLARSFLFPNQTVRR